ncbi:MAG: four helix bundle protein [Chloroflexi bacterium]|nr:four helix bundle protein [Chloroflexota bacterium]
MSVQGLTRLEVWKRAKEFALKIYRNVLPLLPLEEKWNLNSQIMRSSLSVSANIAEGYGRFYYQDNVRFCYNARGSLEETLSHLVFAFEGDEIDRMLNGYIAYLKRSKQGEKEPGVNHAIHEIVEPYTTEPPESN